MLPACDAEQLLLTGPSSSSQSQETKDGLEGMQSLFETASQS